jgi:hypothetical protein
MYHGAQLIMMISAEHRFRRVTQCEHIHGQNKNKQNNLLPPKTLSPGKKNQVERDFPGIPGLRNLTWFFSY